MRPFTSPAPEEVRVFGGRIDECMLIDSRVLVGL